MTPTLSKVRKHAGIAGQFSVSAEVTYPDEPPQHVEFVGSVYGGPVIMMVPLTGMQLFVTDPGRHGAFGTRWVERFFQERP
jgi:hypothetical protein